MEKKTYSFEAVIEKNPDMDAAYIVFPYDIKKEFGKGRVKVEACFDGIHYYGSIVNMGVKDEDGRVRYVIGMPKSVRRQIKKSFGQAVEVLIAERAEDL